MGRQSNDSRSQVGSVFESLVYAVVTPMSAIAFSFHWLLGKNAEPLTGYVIGGAVVVTLGIILFNWLELHRFFKAVCHTTNVIVVVTLQRRMGLTKQNHLLRISLSMEISTVSTPETAVLLSRVFFDDNTKIYNILMRNFTQ